MYYPVAACLFIAALVFFSGCSSGTTTAGVPAGMPSLPEQYSATTKGMATAAPGVATPTPRTSLPVIQPGAQSTINGTGLGNSSGNSTPLPSPPVASFLSSVSMGFSPLTIQFTDTSQNQPTSWNWVFGDGGTSTDQNPVHTYYSSGYFTVNFSATNDGGTGEADRINYVSVYSSGYTGYPLYGDAPLTVLFTDSGTGYPAPISWYWDFGDGFTSTVRNVSHQYTTPGVYTVAHSATNAAGIIWLNKTGYITVT